MLLTPELLGVAIRANAYWRHVTPDWDDLLDALDGQVGDGSSVEMQDVPERVAAFQSAHVPLHVDGQLGPKTAARLRQETWTPPDGSDAFIADGKRIVVRGVKVVDFREPGALSFYSAPKALYGARAKAPDLTVRHWSMTATAHQAFAVLLARGLSVQLLLDDDGTFYQCGDLATMVAWHAGVANQRSVGIEMAGGLAPRAGDPGVPLDVRGDMTRFSSFTPAQVKAMTLAWPALHRGMGIPMVMPMQNATEPRRTDGVTRHADRRVASGAFAGACDHFQVTSKKADAGTQLLAPLRGVGFEVA